MSRVRVLIRPKAGILDPQGQAVERALPALGFEGVANVHVGRLVELDVEDASAIDLQAIGAEGMEVSVPLRGSARPVFQEMIRHLCSSISYGGGASLADVRHRVTTDPGRYLIRLTESSRRESYER